MIFPEVTIFQNDSYEDYRGELFTIYDKENFNLDFRLDKIAISRKNVLRGLHGDQKSTKLITCVHGEIYLVVVDYREESPNYLKWDSIILTQKNKKTVLVPPRFANGHLVLSDEATFFYKWSFVGEYPDIEDQFTVNWKDARININWPIDNPIISKRDK